MSEDMTARTDDGAAKARWTRLAALGLLLAAAGPLLMLIAGTAWGLGGEDVPFLAITGAIGLLGAFFVSRSGTVGKVLGIVAGVLLGMALFWTAFGLATPNSFFDFVPGVLVIPGALLAIVSSVAAIRAGRRRDAPVRAEGGEARGIRIALTAVIVLAALSGVLTLTGRSTADEGAADETVVLKDFEFDQSDYSFTAGSTVLVRNDDPFLHTFTIDDLDIDITLNPGSSELVEIPDESGTYVVFCRPHTFEPEEPAEDDMAANLTIE